MSHPRPFRFGVQAAVASSAEQWSAKVSAVDDLGYSILALNDHFNDQLAPVPALMAAAAVSPRLELGATVFSNDFKHPVVLAKEMATLDLLSGGRTFLGLGAGWLRSDYDEAGIRYDAPGARISRLIEAVAVIKGLFGDGPFSFAGEHYTVTALEGTPKPVRRPHPPLFIGGGGKRILSFAAREADIVGINVDLRSGDFGSYLRGGAAGGPVDEKIAWVREAAGDRWDSIELNVCLFAIAVTEDRDAQASEVAQLYGVDAEQVLATPNVLIGTVGQMVDTLQRRRDRFGISHVLVPYPRAEEFAPVVARLSGQ